MLVYVLSESMISIHTQLDDQLGSLSQSEEGSNASSQQNAIKDGGVVGSSGKVEDEEATQMSKLEVRPDSTVILYSNSPVHAIPYLYYPCRS